MSLYTLKIVSNSLFILLLFSTCSKTKYDNEKIRQKTEQKISELNEFLNLSTEQQLELFDLYYKLGIDIDGVKKDNSLSPQDKQSRISSITSHSGKEMHGILTEEQFEKYRKYQNERKAILSDQIKEKLKGIKFKKSIKSDSIR